MDERQRFLEKKLKEAETIIGEQQKTIAKLQLRKDQYDSILENMSELVERSDSQLNLSYVNNAYCKFYGKSQKDLIASDTMEMVFAEDKEKIYDLLSRIDAENPYYKFEYRLDIDGEIYWMESAGRGFYREDGTIIEYQDVSRDITQFKNMEEELKRTVEQRTAELKARNRELKQLNDYLRGVLLGISEGIVVIDKDGNCEFLNYGPNDLWKRSEKDIAAFFKGLLNDKGSSNALNWMFLKKRAFSDVEMRFSAAAAFFVSGMPLAADEDMVTRGLLVLRPQNQVRRMVTKMSGLTAGFRFRDIVTTSPKLLDVIALAKQAAVGDGNVMIEGESGTGKELFAQSIHNAGERKNGPFVAVNCGAIPRELIASELFGYAEGSFTGAKKGGQPGKFELADGGTLFLDEIGDMPLEQQIALLRVIQERKVTRVGGDREIPVDVRIICATNRDLFKETGENNFREDLYFRLNVIGLRIPPLRERKEDILPLFCSFWVKNAGCTAEDFLNLIQPDVVAILSRYDWPGNVRELQNVADRMMYLSGGGEITAQYLPRHILEATAQSGAGEGVDLTAALSDEKSIRAIRGAKRENRLARDRKQLLAALAAADGNVSKAARALGVSRATFYRKLQLTEDVRE